MRKLDYSSLTVIRETQRRLSEKKFKEYLSEEIKKYELTPEFILEFGEYCDPEYINSRSLTPECIRELIVKGLFDYNVWKKDVRFKNLDILLDEEFVINYGVDVNELLSKGLIISKELFTKYFNLLDSEAVGNMITHVDVDIDPEVVYERLGQIGPAVFTIPCIKEQIRNKDITLLNKLLEQERMKLETFVKMLLVYNVQDVDKLSAINIDSLSEEELNNEGKIMGFRNALINLLDRYPSDICSLIVEKIYCAAEPTLMSRNALLAILTKCDNISEDCLMMIASFFITYDLRTEFINYCKNHSYENALIVLNLS